MVRLRDSWRFSLSSAPTVGNPCRPLQPESVSGPRAADGGAAPGPGLTPSPASGPDRRRRVREGQLGGRPYVLFADGAVDLETVFGVRSFASLDEARAFIGED